MSVFDEIQEALREKADLNARLSLISYEGTPEIKEVTSQSKGTSGRDEFIIRPAVLGNDAGIIGAAL